MIKYDQARSNSTKQGVQTIKGLVTKQCLMVFGRQTFLVCPGPKTARAPAWPSGWSAGLEIWRFRVHLAAATTTTTNFISTVKLTN